MTGFGDARNQNERLSVGVEVRTVNNRYLKLMIRCPDAYAALEGEIEKVVRESISRGTFSATIRVDRVGVENQYQINRDVLQSYWRQLNQAAESLHAAVHPQLEKLLQLPGVISEETYSNSNPHDDWPLIKETLNVALAKLTDFRKTEGESMLRDLRLNAGIISDQLQQVIEIVPQVVANFRDRLLDRVRELLETTDVTVDSSDLIREVSIFSERCDINEEITRLRSHLEQFETFLQGESSQGRKLEFLSQEMFREINTIGAKANNVAIAHCVVEMKSAVEKIREVLQNVE
ncbi:MAG: YicC family protein [Planctomycetaceae bacterium]|nr:YicC family protein [Planctomycetaceae bacterium]